MPVIQHRRWFGSSALGKSIRFRISLLYCAGLFACLGLLGFGTIKPFSLLALSDDTLFTLTYVKTYINGNGFRINPNLAFPGMQDNLVFPSFDFSYRLFLRIVSLFSSEVSTPYYLMYVCGIAGMFGASTYAILSLGFRHSLAVIGAVVYVISPYLMFRSFHHDFLALYFSVPLGAALALRLWSEDDESHRRHICTLCSLLVVATSGLYYAFFSILFMGFVGIVTSIARTSMRPTISMALCAAIVFLVLLVTGFGTGIIDALLGRAHFVQRYPSQQLLFGLRLADARHLLDGIPYIESALNQYDSYRPSLVNGEGLFEWPGLLQTFIIFASVLILPALGVKEKNGWTGMIYICSACIVFGISYSVIGGLGYYFNLLVAPHIRSTARVIPFLSFFSLVIVLGAIEMLIERKTRGARCAAVAMAIALVGSMIPSVSGLSIKQRTMMGTATQENIASVEKVLLAKDVAHITKVLQLPVVGWPEQGLVKQFDPYDHQLYFIFDHKGSATKWSYGGSVAQASFVETKSAVDRSQKFGLAAAARQLQFDGLIIEKRAYEAREIADLKSTVEADFACKIFEDELRVFYSLKPGTSTPCI